MIADLLVSFYRIWHGALKLKGAGRLLRRVSRVIPKLRAFPLRLPEGHVVVLDFEDDSALLIKIDTEGHELAVLRGMAEIIRRHQPVIFFEHLSLSDAEVGRRSAGIHPLFGR